MPCSSHSTTAYILGISCFYHDSAACLLHNGEIIAAAQEERFTRKKHDPDFPEHAISYCLQKGEINISSISLIAFYDKPFLKFERIIETYLAYAPKGLKSFLTATPIWLKDKLWISELIRKKLDKYKGEIIYLPHHESHAASAFYPSPFKESAFLTIDGVGEWTTTSFGIGKNNSIEIYYELHFPHSLGLLYSTFTYYTGFRVNSGEYKVMGLAPYGDPKYVNLIYDYLIDLKQDGSFKLNMKYFDFCVGKVMTNDKFHKLFGGPPRSPETLLTQKEMDISASIQVVTEEIMLRMAYQVKQTTSEKNLCLAGGVALNCVGNGKILKAGIFDNIWIQPSAGDAGGALGAALAAWYQYLGNKRENVEQASCLLNKNGVIEYQDSQKGSFLGPKFSEKYIESFLKTNVIPYKKYSLSEIPDLVSDMLIQKKIIGWFEGRMEFGPRALGARSILGDARSSDMQSYMNLKIKFRESFRPFAPTVLKEKCSEYFELSTESPYMLLVANVHKNKLRQITENEETLWGIDKVNVVRSEIPAVTHVDYSARIQTIDKSSHPLYYELIRQFYKKTGCPVIINTSFNVRGEPIVCTPEDAYKCFMRTNIDYLVMENFVLDKINQPEFKDKFNWKKEYELD